MTSKKEYLVPDAIEPELAMLLNNGVGQVEAPTLKAARLGDGTLLYQIWCHSPRVRGNSLGVCNHSLGAIIDNVEGFATFSMLLECPKCRTAYALTLDMDCHSDSAVKLVEAKVVNLNRSVQQFVDVNLDSDKNTWIQVHEKKS